VNLNRISRIRNSACPRCKSYDDHTVTNWEVHQPGAGVREHCCKHCGMEWIEWVTADLNNHFIAWKPEASRPRED